MKNDIAERILRFEPRITVSHPQAQSIFQEVLRDRVELLYYLSGYSYSVRYSSLVVELSYTNQDVPVGSIKKIKSPEELEHLLHKSVEASSPKIVACVPSSMRVDRIYSDFNVGYGGYYSNLVNTEYSTSGFEGTGVIFVTFKFTYRISRIKLIMMESAVDKEVERLSRVLFLPEMSKEEKAYIAHNYLAKTVEYWLKKDATPHEMSYMQSAYGALINHKCVCQGYAEAYKRLLDYVGIECHVICGKIKGSDEHHAWNAVSFDGLTFHHVDVTWDSRGGGVVETEYFCLSDKDLQPHRLWSRLSDIICPGGKNILRTVRASLAMNRSRYIAKGVDGRYL
ncbi:MAG: hypothetical protein J6B29_04790 [Clostridia bacterium]|nr:hypothetical protein [Clostridia bacterium]